MFKKSIVVLLAMCMALTALPLSMGVAADEPDQLGDSNPTVTFICNGEILKTVSYKDGDTAVEEPELPIIKGNSLHSVFNYMDAGMVLYEYVWPDYELTGESITVYARCKLVAYKVNFYKDETDKAAGTVYATRTYTVEDASYDIPSVPPQLDENGVLQSSNGTWRIYSIDAADRIITVVAKYYTDDPDYAETHNEHSYYRTFRGIYACAQCGELAQGKIHVNVDNEEYDVYVKDGIPQHLGVIIENGRLRYVNSRGRIPPEGLYEIGDAYTNGYIPAGTYEISKDGYIVVPETSKNGLCWDEDGEIRYYVDGVSVYAGVVLYEGHYYYINSSRTAVKDQWYGITKTNDLIDVGEYWIDENGVIDRTSKSDPGASPTSKEGLSWDEDGEIRYYIDGEPVYAGVVLYEGHYYYINSGKTAVKNQWYGITKTNGYFDVGEYWIDEKGVIDVANQPADNTSLLASFFQQGFSGLYTVNGYVFSVNIPQR